MNYRKSSVFNAWQLLIHCKSIKPIQILILENFSCGSNTGSYSDHTLSSTDEAYGNALSSIEDTTCGIRRQVSNQNNLTSELETKRKMMTQLNDQLKVRYGICVGRRDSLELIEISKIKEITEILLSSMA